jgi:hypothetical protein
VNPYRGDEIPRARELGLEPGRVYQLLRDPEELARSVPTWNGMPLMIKHRPQSANDHDRDAVVGALGTNAAFQNPYLDNSLTVWDGEAIAGVESGQMRQLSCGYHYDADMTPGDFNGTPYDGVMRNIRGNHVSLVESGRAGNDVMVMDAAFQESQHPRGPGGQFGTGGLGGSTPQAKTESFAARNGVHKDAVTHGKGASVFQTHGGGPVAQRERLTKNGFVPSVKAGSSNRGTHTHHYFDHPEGHMATMIEPNKGDPEYASSTYTMLHKPLQQKAKRPGKDAAMDAKPKGNHMVKQVATITPRTAVAMGALQVYLPPKLAADAKLPNLGRLLRGAKSGKEITSRVTTAMKPLLAKDADLSDLGGLIDALKGPEANAGRPAEGPQAIKTENPADTGLGDPEGTNEEMLSEDDDLEEKVRELLAGKLDDADLEMLMKLISPADPDAIVDPDASADPDDLGAPSADPPDTAPPEAKPDVDDDSSGKTEVHVHPPGGKKDDDAKDRGMFGRDRRRVGRDAEPPQLEKENSVDKPAMDAAIKAASTAAVADAISQTTRRLNARSDAERFVRPWIGEVTVAMDTAEDVLGFALKAMNVPAKGITTADGMKTLLSLVPKPGDARPSPRMAADSAGAADFATRFPGASRLRVVG